MDRLELQYVGTRLAKVNYFTPEPVAQARDPMRRFALLQERHSREFPEYFHLANDLLRRTAATKLPYSLSIKDGKLTAYGGYMADVRGYFARFGLFFDPQRYVSYSASLGSHGDEILKAYDRRKALYALPPLPDGARHKFGVATSYAADKSVLGREIFFNAAPAQMAAWVDQYGLGGYLRDAEFYGVAFERGEPVGPIKSCIRPPDTPYTENCWVSGVRIRRGLSPASAQGQALLARVDPLWLAGSQHITNVGANHYDLGVGAPVEIVSVYFNGIAPSAALRAQFGVPESVQPPLWYGIKFAPAQGWVWLKVADMDYAKFAFPVLPEGAVKTFGVADVYPLTGEQPAHHSSVGADWVDLSFSTKDHAGVRAYCIAHGLDDPAPHLPGTLDLWGVYSLTYNRTTLQASRLKFYDYEGAQRFTMEMYVASVVEEGEAAVFDAGRRVLAKNLKDQAW